MPDTPVTEPPSERLSISERAAKRDRMAQSGRDRYGSLLRTLQAGRELPVGGKQRTRYEWNPIFGKLIVAVVAVVVAWFMLRAGVTIWRDNTTDTWAGPDASVVSGQRLEDCPPVNILHDDAFPTWIRYQGTIFALANARRPVAEVTAENGYQASGYTNDSRLLLLMLDPATGSPLQDQLLVYDPRASVGELYRLQPECS
ncbi:MAG: hypothetical protein ABWY52_00450 [Candidatus Limnocylindrales bacterium]